MSTQIARLLNALQQTFQHPGSNPLRSSFVAALLLLVGLFVILGALFIITPTLGRVVRVRRYRLMTMEGEDEDVVEEANTDATPASAEPELAESADESDEDAEAREIEALLRRSRIVRTVSAVCIPLLIIAAVLVAYHATGTNGYCAAVCHGGEQSVYDAVAANHARCVQCHELPGVTAIPLNVTWRVAMIVDHLEGKKAHGPAVVSSASCMACHTAALRTTVKWRGIRMSHAEPMSSGMTCTSCHPATGHAMSVEYSMSSCTPCHDGHAASAKCAECHDTSPLNAKARTDLAAVGSLGTGKVTFPIVQIGQTIDCSACHVDEEKCDACHGLRLPHSDAFVNGGHARNAGFGGRAMCTKCHTIAWCNGGCHIGLTANGSAHPANWITQHAKAPWNSGCVCHQGRSHRTFPMCNLCHDPKTHKLLPLSQ